MKFFWRALFFLLPFLYPVYASAQPGHWADCGETCFTSQVMSVEKISATCTTYSVKVSFSGDCAHGLSHFTLAVPCGRIEDLRNSENWEQVIGLDPTTGLTGFKIDGIPDFGKTSLQAFTVTFTVCADGEACAGLLNCWQPVVAYKAATCVDYDTLTVTCRKLEASLEKRDVSCFGAHDGALNVVIEEGVEPFTFLWSDQSTGQSLTDLPAGDYSVVVRDASGAELALEASLSEPEEIVLSGVSRPASCNGVPDGSIDITASGGAGDFVFLWSNGAGSEDLENLAPGYYTVNVTDANGCSATSGFTVGSSNTIDISSTQVKPDCNDSNGGIDLTVSGGIAPYTFAWSNGSTTEDLTNIGAGLYSVTVTDQGGCFKKAAFFIKENNTLVVSGATSPATCADNSAGSIELSVTGGTAPYSYQWSDGETAADRSGLTSGYYTVVVTDAKGCTANAGFTISTQTFQVQRKVEEPSCHDAEDGSISIEDPVGGTPPYSYEWSTGETNPLLENLGAGTYSVIVKDAAGCSRTLTFTLKNPPQIQISATIANGACGSEGGYSIDLTVSGGTAPYTFNWSDGSTTADRDHLESGTYTVTVTDARGCTASKEIAVEAQTPTWSCLINPPATMPECGSVDNELSSAVSDADSYTWTIESSDGTWSLTSSTGQSILFNAGAANSSATVTLTIQKDGCTKTCSYTLTTCTGAGDDDGSDPGGEDHGNGNDDDDDGDQSCEECFLTTATLLSQTGGCRTYEMVVHTDGLCRHELSHWTIAIPCGVLTDYANSEGWKMEYGQDPTTGLYGLKVDDIDGFGKAVDSFTVTFTICADDACALTAWEPTVAYKAGLCVVKETIGVAATDMPEASFAAYPNPFEETINFEGRSSGDYANLQLIDQYGTVVGHREEKVKEDGTYSIRFTSSWLPRGIYYYRMTVGGKTLTGKISKR